MPYGKKVIWVDEDTHTKVKLAAKREGKSMSTFMDDIAKHIDDKGNRLWVYIDEKTYNDLKYIADELNVTIDAAMSNAWNLLKMSLQDDKISNLIIKKKKESGDQS